jgi:DNA-directed RNA polymerase specialized sigma24 family protein
MAARATSTPASSALNEAQSIHAREGEYRRRVHLLLRGEYRSYFHGAGLGEADREPIACEVVDDVLLAEASGRLRASERAARLAYLKVALWRRLRMEWRHRRRHPVDPSDPHDGVLDRVASDADTAKAALNRCALASVNEALEEALDDREREVARLFLFEERSEREAAGELGIGRSAAANRLDEVREKLRAHLAERGITSAEEAWCS